MFELLKWHSLKFSNSEFSKQPTKTSLIFSLESGETLHTDVGNNEDHSSELGMGFFPPEKEEGREMPSFGLASSEDIKLIEKWKITKITLSV